MNQKESILKAYRALVAIRSLATCDDTLYHDGINKELEAAARDGLNALRPLVK